ncbi:MAG: hypothetical protein BWZ10_02550 [candidate division BRC1 bacterium ADurb.BinA364]|nr:MAG: hypothetical protein BWZ10_02550 [candidate division BRC1 bacterium ADurb.BinA364]
MASTWDLSEALSINPKNSIPARKTDASAKSSPALPRNGTANSHCPSATASPTSARPMAKYGATLPKSSSGTSTGVPISCSIVPISHSRAIVTLVNIAAMTTMTSAMMPGMIELALRRSGLYQARHSISTGASGGRRPLRSRWRTKRLRS